jgi:hypothetical protein
MKRKYVVSFGILIGMLVLVVISCRTMFLSSEGETEAKAFWDKTIYRCGDFYYGTADPRQGFAEYEGFSYTTTTIPLTEADRLMHYEWRVESRIHSRAFRYWNPAWRRWNDWRDGEPSIFERGIPPLSPMVRIEKRNGEVF